jgi:hypothetical protein
MKKHQFTEERIIRVSKEAEAGRSQTFQQPSRLTISLRCQFLTCSAMAIWPSVWPAGRGASGQRHGISRASCGLLL